MWIYSCPEMPSETGCDVGEVWVYYAPLLPPIDYADAALLFSAVLVCFVIAFGFRQVLAMFGAR